MSKHYQNDYKKLMGVDQSRTASQKLLDRALGKRESTLTTPHQPPDSNPRKLPKKQPSPQTPQNQPRQLTHSDALTKLSKCLTLHNNLLKMQKSLQILRKLLSEKQFIQNVRTEQLIEIVNCFVKRDNFGGLGSLGEMIRFGEVEGKVLGDIVEILKERMKGKGEEKGEGEGEGEKEKYGQYEGIQEVIAEIELEIQFLMLITDDNFQFSKAIAQLQKSIFSAFETPSSPNTLSIQPIKQQPPVTTPTPLHPLTHHIEHTLLPKLQTLPNLSLQWCRTGLTTLLKQFIAQHKDKLENPKHFLSEYNKFIQGRDKGKGKGGEGLGEGCDVMGKKVGIGGGSYTVVERFDATGTWCKRQ